MLWRSDKGPPPSELTDALAVNVYDYAAGWRFAGFVVELNNATVGDALRFAAQADPNVGGRPVFAKRIQAADIKFPRRTVTQPAPTVDVAVEDFTGQT